MTGPPPNTRRFIAGPRTDTEFFRPECPSVHELPPTEWRHSSPGKSLHRGRFRGCSLAVVYLPLRRSHDLLGEPDCHDLPVQNSQIPYLEKLELLPTHSSSPGMWMITNKSLPLVACQQWSHPPRSI